MNAPILLLLSLVICLTAVPRFREIGPHGRFWILFRSLFPSWRFFDELGQVPRLSFRIVSDVGSGSWIDASERVPRKIGTLFLNSRGNLRMAGNSLMERLVSDINDLPEGAETDLEKSVSYELVRRLARERVLVMGKASAGDRFQFRVMLSVPGSEGSGEEVLLSRVHEV